MIDDKSLSQEIITKLVICGHFIHFKLGGKASRRRIFSVLLERGEMPQKELQEHLDVCSGSISEILSRTETDGYIEKSKNLSDKRNVNLKLTESGKALAIQMEKENDFRICRMLSCFSDDEKKDLYGKLSQLVKLWNSIESEFDLDYTDILNKNDKLDKIV